MSEGLDARPVEFESRTGAERGGGPHDLVALLRTAVADTYVVLLKTQVAHWDASGPSFYGIHKLTEDQYGKLFEAVDDLAERIRALGGRPPETLRELAAEASAPDVSSAATTRSLLEALVGDHDHVAAGMRQSIDAADAAGDPVTADLLTARVAFHEKAAWMLRALTA